VTAPKDLIGHRHQRDSLARDLATDNLAHAYLFSGPRHVGKFAEPSN
jgi:DNA polymerase III gamma/tau subunit